MRASSVQMIGFDSFRKAVKRVRPVHREQFVEQERFIASVASNLYRCWAHPASILDERDFHSLARMAAFEVIVEPRSPGVNMQTKISGAIRRRIIDETRRVTHAKCKDRPVAWVSLNSLVGPSDPEESPEHVDMLFDSDALTPFDHAELNDTFAHIHRVVATLDRRSRQIFELRFVKQALIEDIAAKFRISQSMVCHIIKRMVVLLRQHLQDPWVAVG